MAAEEGTHTPPLNPIAGLEGTHTPPLNPFAGPEGQFLLPAKMSWPELIGETSEEARKKILEGMPGAEVQVVPPDHFVTMDYRTNRVRIYTDSAGKVAEEPRIG